MLRSLKIPTRLVSGYGPGTARAQSGRAGQRQEEVTTSDAHSWVEAYFPGYGWIPFEPTPPSSQGNYQPFPRGQPGAGHRDADSRADQRPGTTPKPGNADVGTPKVDPDSDRATHRLPASVMISLAVLGGIVVLIVAALLWMLLPRSLAGAWKRVETLGVISGVDRRRAETHRAFAARLARARPRARAGARRARERDRAGRVQRVRRLGVRASAGAADLASSAARQATLRPRRSPG